MIVPAEVACGCKVPAEVACPEASRVTDPNQEWGIRNIIGRKILGGEVHDWVDWEPTWMPEYELDGATGLVDAF